MCIIYEITIFGNWKIRYSIAFSSYSSRALPHRWIGHDSEFTLSPFSPDLNPLDLFFWAYIKSLVDTEEIHTRYQLLQKIVRRLTLEEEINKMHISKW